MLNIFKKQFPSKLFTYFIPVPPSRSSGYREKQVDKLINSLLEQNFKLIDFKIESIATETSAGMWIALHLQPQCLKSSQLDINKFLEEVESASALPEDGGTIDGLYSLDE